ncbi:xin actin-binding repeat-containing protein 2 isoform X2 [Danio rerio]
MAVYQAAAAKQDRTGFSSAVMEEAEVCSLPGGLASIRRQFETESRSSVHTVTQIQHSHRAVQEVSDSSVLSVSSSAASRQASQQVFLQDERHLRVCNPVAIGQIEPILLQSVLSVDPATKTMNDHDNSTSTRDQIAHKREIMSSYENHNNQTEEDEYYPKLSTKELAQHFEKTIEEAAPSKKIKIERDKSRAQLQSDVSASHQTVRTEIASTLNSVSTNKAELVEPLITFDDQYIDDEEDLEYLPPPPPDLLEEPSDDAEIFPEPPLQPVKHTVNREQHFRQRELMELKRLCKHIHPDVRKDLEKDFYNDEDIEAVGDVQEAAYQFEHTGRNSNGSPDREYLEWDEILRGEVQSMRWMFENKPLDCIKDDSDNEEESRKIVQQEFVAGGDVRNTALMFEMQPIDEVGQKRDSKRNYLVNEVGKRDVRAAAWLFETKPMDTLNKLHTDDEQTKEVIFTHEATEGDMKSVRYIFENQEMDSLGDTETMDEKQLLSLKSVLEEIKSEVKKIIWMFDTQCMCVMREHSGEMVLITSVRREETEKGDIKTSRWLFETQSLNDIEMDISQVRLISSVSMEDNHMGDGKRGRWLFETKRLDSINSQWERLQNQQKEILGADVRKHCMVFETQPMDTLKDDANSRPVATEQIIGGNVRSVRHLFENAPPDELKELPEVGKLQKRPVYEEEQGDVRHQKWKFENEALMRMIKDEDNEAHRLKTVALEEEKGDVGHQRWLFENQRLEDIQEEKKVFMKTIDSEQIDKSYKGDVRRNCWVFETQPMDTLKDDSNARPASAEEIIGGDVQSARHFFETAPKDEIKELAEVGKLKRMMTSEEKGDVRHQKWLFESQPLEQIREERKEITKTVNLEDIENVDVRNYKQIFETYDLSQYDESQRIQVEGVTTGSVRSNKDLFESMPLYALQDSSGHYHKVRTVRREEIVKGDVRSCQWMFETRPIDQFDESISKFQIIKGITQQEVESGDVKTAKWLFETQPLDAIKYFSNIEDDECVTKETADIVKGDVKTCKWLFETKPIDTLYERKELESTKDSDEVQKGDVKTCTWLFESQTLDAIQDNSEKVLQIRTVNQEDIHGKDVRMARFLFETENLENIAGEDREAFKSVTEIDIQSGDVSRMKYIFETQSSDVVSSTSEDFMRQLRSAQAEDIQKGNVGNCKWLFENQPIDEISENPSELKGARMIQDVQGGNVDKGRFIFETYSLDKIQDSEAEIGKLQKVIREDEEKGDVKTYAMMFETQPLYAIQDKEGHYHEVTTLTKEEIQRGDVVGARWLFETKPLDSIRETDEVYILKAVTQEDIHSGDVSSARWRFETQALDKIAEDAKISIKTVEDIQGGDVKTNKQRFESDAMSQKLVRTVSMSEIHKGDVRTAKWMFETHTIDQIHAEKSEEEMNTVVLEEQLKGDVKQSVWLFEKNPLDHINESEEQHIQVVSEDIPKADVKSTTWLFETTPFTEFNESRVEKTEIVGKSVKATLDELYTQKMVDSKGIIIEADEIGDVRMAKYNLMNKDAPEIQKEEIIKGDLQNIMINLLNRQEKTEEKIIINAEERGDISGTVQQLLQEHSGTSVEKEEIMRGDIQEAINNLLKEESTGKRGILIQEDERGDIRMTIYSLFNSHEESSTEKEYIVRGNVKGCLERLCNPDTEEVARIKVEETERGKVSFYSTCIESGALDYLKKLQVEPDEGDLGKIEKEEIIGGDIKETKLILTRNQAQIGRLVDREDIVPGDVHNTVKVFMTEPQVSFEHLQKEEIVRGDLQAALNSLTQSINQAVVLEKEEVVKADLTMTLRSLEEAQNQPKEVEKPEIIPGNIKGALQSLKDSSSTKVEVVVEDLVPGDIKGTLKSLEEAKHAVREVEKEMIVKGDIHTAIQSLQEASNERKVCQQDIGVQGDVKGKIQLLLEPPPSPRMQRRASTEGDVKLSIKSLYDTQEQVQSEKEEVIKGDVKGTIKSLMETARRSSPTIPRREPIRKVKVPAKAPSPSVKDIPAQRPTPAVKNLDMSSESQSTHKQSMQNRYGCQESSTISGHTTTCSQETKTTVLEHKTIVQTHGVKTLKTDFRNLKKSGCKGLIRLDKRKKQDMCMPPPLLDPEPPLPPPPSPPPDYDSISFPTPPPSIRGDHDLPLPPTPPPGDPAKTELDHLPPPPSPSPLPPAPPTAELDLLPPPPTEQELDILPLPSLTPSKPTKMTVKPVKAPMLCKVPKLEPAISFEQINVHSVEESRKNVTTSSAKSTMVSSKIQSAFTKQPPESPRPPKKVFTNLMLTPPPSPPPVCKSPVSKFKTPLIQAEQKYRQQREESCTPPPPPSRSPAFEILMHESVSAALEMLSSESTSTVQSEASISFDFTQERAQKSVTKSESATDSYDSSKHTAFSNAPPSKALITATNEQSPPESPVISSVKQSIISNQSSLGSSGQQQTTSTSTKRKKKRSMTTNIQQVTKTVIKSIDKDEITASVITDKTQSAPTNASETVEKDVSSISLSEDKTKEESSPKKNQEKSLSDRSKANKESQIKDAEQRPQKADSQKVKKINKSVKLESSEKATAEQDNIQVKESRERSPTETEGKVEKMAKEKPVEEPPAAPKKKRRSKNKKDREAAQSNNTASVSPTEATPAEPKWPVLTSDEKQEEITVVQTQRTVQAGHAEFYKEVIKTESTVQQQSIQEEGMAVQLQKQAGGSQQIPEESKDESRNVPIKMTGKSAQKEPAESSAESADTSLRQAEAQKMLSHISELQGVAGKMDSKSVKTLLNEMPAWLLGPEEKSDLEEAAAEHNEQKLKEILTHVKNLLMLFEGTIEKHECEATSEKWVVSGTTQRISKISIGSTKCETQKVVKEETKTKRKSRKQQMSNTTTPDPRGPSPSLRMRSPSPTFITIESTRRTDSPQRAAPSPTPPTPPPRRSETPSSRISRASPSPTASRADSLTRLKKATATLSRGASPDPVPHVVVSGKKSEIVESPATFHRQIQIDSKSVEEKKVKMTSSETAVVSIEDKQVTETHASFQTAVMSINANISGDVFNILEHSGTSKEDVKSKSAKEVEKVLEVDLSGQAKTIETSEEKVSIRKDPADITEKPGRETEDLELDTEKKARQQEDMAAFNIKDIKNVFEMSEQSSPFKALQNKQEEQESRVSEIASEGSKPELPPEREQCSQLSSPLPVRKDVKVDKSVDPTGFSETKTVTECYSSVDEFGTKIIGSTSTTMVSKHTESVTTQRAPFSYADAVKKKTPEVTASPEASAEELMKNFHKTWTESESVFKSLGVTDSSTKIRDVCGVQEEGLPDGRPDSRQKEVP